MPASGPEAVFAGSGAVTEEEAFDAMSRAGRDTPLLRQEGRGRDLGLAIDWGRLLAASQGRQRRGRRSRL